MTLAKKKEYEQRFWNDVEKLLTVDHGHSQRNAKEGIESYKHSIDQRTGGNIPDAVYNQGEEKTAEIVNEVIRSGLPALHSQPV